VAVLLVAPAEEVLVPHQLCQQFPVAVVVAVLVAAWVRANSAPVFVPHQLFRQLAVAAADGAAVVVQVTDQWLTNRHQI
jgi:hypothetical protein